MHLLYPTLVFALFQVVQCVEKRDLNWESLMLKSLSEKTLKEHLKNEELVPGYVGFGRKTPDVNQEEENENINSGENILGPQLNGNSNIFSKDRKGVLPLFRDYNPQLPSIGRKPFGSNQQMNDVLSEHRKTTTLNRLKAQKWPLEHTSEPSQISKDPNWLRRSGTLENKLIPRQIFPRSNFYNSKHLLTKSKRKTKKDLDKTEENKSEDDTNETEEENDEDETNENEDEDATEETDEDSAEIIEFPNFQPSNKNKNYKEINKDKMNGKKLKKLCPDNGFFPDLNKCSKFYLCHDNNVITFKCKKNKFIYNPVLQNCMPYFKENCKTFNCKKKGNRSVPYKSDPQYYASCKNGDPKTIHKCSNGYTFVEWDQKCRNSIPLRGTTAKFNSIPTVRPTSESGAISFNKNISPNNDPKYSFKPEIDRKLSSVTGKNVDNFFTSFPAIRIASPTEPSNHHNYATDESSNRKIISEYSPTFYTTTTSNSEGSFFSVNNPIPQWNSFTNKMTTEDSNKNTEPNWTGISRKLGEKYNFNFQVTPSNQSSSITSAIDDKFTVLPKLNDDDSITASTPGVLEIQEVFRTKHISTNPTTKSVNFTSETMDNSSIASKTSPLYIYLSTGSSSVDLVHEGKPTASQFEPKNERKSYYGPTTSSDYSVGMTPSATLSKSTDGSELSHSTSNSNSETSEVNKTELLPNPTTIEAFITNYLTTVRPNEDKNIITSSVTNPSSELTTVSSIRNETNIIEDINSVSAQNGTVSIGDNKSNPTYTPTSGSSLTGIHRVSAAIPKSTEKVPNPSTEPMTSVTEITISSNSIPPSSVASLNVLTHTNSSFTDEGVTNRIPQSTEESSSGLYHNGTYSIESVASISQVSTSTASNPSFKDVSFNSSVTEIPITSAIIPTATDVSGNPACNSTSDTKIMKNNETSVSKIPSSTPSNISSADILPRYSLHNITQPTTPHTEMPSGSYYYRTSTENPTSTDSILTTSKIFHTGSNQNNFNSSNPSFLNSTVDKPMFINETNISEAGKNTSSNNTIIIASLSTNPATTITYSTETGNHNMINNLSFVTPSYEVVGEKYSEPSTQKPTEEIVKNKLLSTTITTDMLKPGSSLLISNYSSSSTATPFKIIDESKSYSTNPINTTKIDINLMLTTESSKNAYETHTTPIKSYSKTNSFSTVIHATYVPANSTILTNSSPIAEHTTESVSRQSFTDLTSNGNVSSNPKNLSDVSPTPELDSSLLTSTVPRATDSNLQRTLPTNLQPDISTNYTVQYNSANPTTASSLVNVTTHVVRDVTKPQVNISSAPTDETPRSHITVTENITHSPKLVQSANSDSVNASGSLNNTSNVYGENSLPQQNITPNKAYNRTEMETSTEKLISNNSSTTPSLMSLLSNLNETINNVTTLIDTLMSTSDVSKTANTPALSTNTTDPQTSKSSPDYQQTFELSVSTDQSPAVTETTTSAEATHLLPTVALNMNSSSSLDAKGFQKLDVITSSTASSVLQSSESDIHMTNNTLTENNSLNVSPSPSFSTKPTRTEKPNLQSSTLSNSSAYSVTSRSIGKSTDLSNFSTADSAENRKDAASPSSSPLNIVIYHTSDPKLSEVTTHNSSYHETSGQQIRRTTRDTSKLSTKTLSNDNNISTREHTSAFEKTSTEYTMPYTINNTNPIPTFVTEFVTEPSISSESPSITNIAHIAIDTSEKTSDSSTNKSSNLSTKNTIDQETTTFPSFRTLSSNPTTVASNATAVLYSADASFATNNGLYVTDLYDRTDQSSNALPHPTVSVSDVKNNDNATIVPIYESIVSENNVSQYTTESSSNQELNQHPGFGISKLNSTFATSYSDTVETSTQPSSSITNTTFVTSYSDTVETSTQPSSTNTKSTFVTSYSDPDERSTQPSSSNTNSTVVTSYSDIVETSTQPSSTNTKSTFVTSYSDTDETSTQPSSSNTNSIVVTSNSGTVETSTQQSSSITNTTFVTSYSNTVETSTQPSNTNLTVFISSPKTVKTSTQPSNTNLTVVTSSSKTVETSTQPSSSNTNSTFVTSYSDTVETSTRPSNTNSTVVTSKAETVETSTQPSSSNTNSTFVTSYSDTVETLTRPSNANSTVVTSKAGTVETLTQPSSSNTNSTFVTSYSDTVETSTQPSNTNLTVVTSSSETVETSTQPSSSNTNSTFVTSYSDTVETSTQPSNTNLTVVTSSSETVETSTQPSSSNTNSTSVTSYSDTVETSTQPSSSNTNSTFVTSYSDTVETSAQPSFLGTPSFTIKVFNTSGSPIISSTDRTTNFSDERNTAIPKEYFNLNSTTIPKSQSEEQAIFSTTVTSVIPATVLSVTENQFNSTISTDYVDNIKNDTISSADSSSSSSNSSATNSMLENSVKHDTSKQSTTIEPLKNRTTPFQFLETNELNTVPNLTNNSVSNYSSSSQAYNTTENPMNMSFTNTSTPEIPDVQNDPDSVITPVTDILVTPTNPSNYSTIQFESATNETLFSSTNISGEKPSTLLTSYPNNVRPASKSTASIISTSVSKAEPVTSTETPTSSIGDSSISNDSLANFINVSTKNQESTVHSTESPLSTNISSTAVSSSVTPASTTPIVVSNAQENIPNSYHEITEVTEINSDIKQSVSEIALNSTESNFSTTELANNPTGMAVSQITITTISPTVSLQDASEKRPISDSLHISTKPSTMLDSVLRNSSEEINQTESHTIEMTTPQVITNVPSTTAQPDQNGTVTITPESTNSTELVSDILESTIRSTTQEVTNLEAATASAPSTTTNKADEVFNVLLDNLNSFFG